MSLGGMLSDAELMRLSVHRIIDPFAEGSLSGCAYDVRVGDVLRSRNRATSSFDLTQPYVIGSGECVTITTLETINLRNPVSAPDGSDQYLFALILNKHTIAARGLFHPATSVDPGFHGVLALTFINLGPIGYQIRHGDKIAKIVFSTIAGKVDRIYGVSQQPSVREGNTDMALIIDRPEEVHNDIRLAQMYGEPIRRLYERVQELEKTLERDQPGRGRTRR